ncbi:MAG: hypothetical protein ACKOYC_09010 [Bacteroidota bacterium]
MNGNNLRNGSMMESKKIFNTSLFVVYGLARLSLKDRFMVAHSRFWFLSLLLVGSVVNSGFGQDTTTTQAIRETKIALVMSFEVHRNGGIDPANPESPGVHPLSLPALHFYEGARLAVDSLTRKGFKYDLVCFESPTDSSNMEKLLDGLVEDSFTVFIGFVPDNLLPITVERTAEAGIKLILTQAYRPDAIRGHSHSALAYASTATQCSLVVDRFLKKFPNANFVVIKGKKHREKEVAEAFRAAVDTLASGTSTVRVVDLATSGVSAASGGVVSGVPNIIFFVSSEETVVNTGLASLAKSCPRNTIVCGMPTWVNFESIDFMSHERIQISLFDNNHVDYRDPERAKYRKRFVNAYWDDPLSSGYAGYDLFTYLVPLLRKYPNADLEELLVGDKKRPNPFYDFKEFPEGGFESHRMTITYLVEYRFIPMDKVDAFRKDLLKKKAKIK